MATVKGKHLADALGEDYVAQMCGGALFVTPDGMVNSLRGVHEAGVSYLVNQLDPKADTPAWRANIIPQEVLTSLADLSYPRLGYRNINDRRYGNVVVYLSSMRSAMRGLRANRIEATYPDSVHSAYPMSSESWELLREAQRVKVIYNPTFFSMKEGLEQLMNGKLLSFALSEDVAVAIAATAGPDVIASILFRGRVVGKVAADGTVTLNNKFLQKYGIRDKLNR